MVGDINNIIVIESLSGEERKTGTELYNDCIVRYIEYFKSDIKCKLYTVDSKNDIIDILNYYAFNSPYINGGILVHFEMHGCEDRLGLVLADGSKLTWNELIEICRKININTVNSLYLTLATCFGRHLYKGASLKMKSPYSCYISTSSTTVPSEIIEQYSLLFENLIKNGNLVKAYLEMEKNGTKFYYKDSEKTFEVAFKRVSNKMKNDSSLRDQLYNEAKEICNRNGIECPSKDSYELIRKIALQDLYVSCKKNFYFP